MTPTDLITALEQAVTYYGDLSDRIDRLMERADITSFGWWGRLGNRIKQKRISKLHVYRAQIYSTLFDKFGVCAISALIARQEQDNE